MGKRKEKYADEVEQQFVRLATCQARTSVSERGCRQGPAPPGLLSPGHVRLFSRLLKAIISLGPAENRPLQTKYVIIKL